MTMAKTIYIIITTYYPRHSFGITKEVSTKAFSDKQTAEEYFRNSIVEKVEKFGFDKNEIYLPLKASYYNIRENFRDEALDDWFEIQIFETTLD